jgi:murein L,D-transpeptidase YafK
MSFRRQFETAVRLGALAAALSALSACEDSGSLSHRSLSPIPAETIALMERAGATKEAPTLIRAYKKEAEFEVWKMRSDGRYAHVKTYPMCRWSGQLGPKTRQGDRQVPEGFYSISPGQLNPNSGYYLSFNVGYPNAYDRAWGHDGGAIMVHGACSSAGCFSMTDRQIAEIYAIARTSLNAGQRSIQMQSYPFRMSAENLARHRLDPNIGFWRQLKEGADHFEVTKQEPRVAVCGRRYVFDASPADGQGLDPNGVCPTLKYETEVREQVAEKAAVDEAKIAELAAQGVTPVKLVYRDGGQHPAFYASMAEVSRPEALAPPTEIALDDRPSRAASKSAATLAAKSPVVTLAAAKALAKEENAAGAKPSERPPEPSRVSDLGADQVGSVRGWISLHKDKEKSAAGSTKR